MSLPARWRTWSHHVAARSARERGLILLSGLVVLLTLAGYGWLDEMSMTLTQQRQALLSTQRDVEIISLENLGKQARLQRDPNQAVHEQLARVQGEQQRLDETLNAQTVDLIPAHDMPQVLETLLARSSKLHMLALRSLPPTPLVAGKQQANLYKHGIRLQLEGSYFNIYQYLKALETLPRHFYWRQFDYQVKAHPTAVMEMEIYTLSTSKEFIRG